MVGDEELEIWGMKISRCDGLADNYMCIKKQNVQPVFISSESIPSCTCIACPSSLLSDEFTTMTPVFISVVTTICTRNRESICLVSLKRCFCGVAHLFVTLSGDFGYLLRLLPVILQIWPEDFQCFDASSSLSGSIRSSQSVMVAVPVRKKSSLPPQLLNSIFLHQLRNRVFVPLY